MRLTCNAQKFMAAIAAIAMFCFGPAMARETVFVKNGDSYVTKDDNVIYRMTKSPVQTTEACSSVDGLDVKNGDVTVVNGDLDGLYEYGDVAKFECNKGVKKTYDYKKSDVTLDLTSAKAGRAFPAALNSKNMAGQNEFYVLDEDMKVKKVYENCPNNKVSGDEIGKDESKCYEKVTIYDVRVACRALQKAGDGKSSVFMQSSFCAAKYSGVTASKDKCYDISGDKLCSYSENGDAPSTSESATCYDGFTKKTSGTFYKSETDSVTAASNRPYCVKSENTFFYREPSERPYTEYYDASVTLYEDCSYADVNGLTSDKKGVAGKGIVAKQNGETVCYMNMDKDGCYAIGSAFELYGFANVVNNATYGSQICGKLTKDIVVNKDVLKTNGALNGSNFTPWTPMNVKSGVQVTLNGAGKTISGLYFNDENQDDVGLFGDVLGTVSISNLGVKDSYFKGGFDVGGLVGYNGGELTITNSYNSGTVSGSKDYVGGLVGENYKSATLTITNSYNSGTVSGSGNIVGGLVGISSGELSITNSYNSGTVSGSGNNAGGLVGDNNGGTLTIENSYNSGTVSGNGIFVGGLVGDNVGENAKLTITNSFFVATDKSGDDLGGTKKTSLDDFHNGTVAFLLHNWCEKDGDNCKVGGKNGSVWGQDFTKENSLPDLSGKFVGGTPHTLTLHTFKGDTRKLPTIYLEGSEFELPTDLTREGFVFLGWSSKEVAESFSDIVTSIASDATGPKKFYAQWKKLNANGCFEISSTIDLYAFANVVNNATNGSKVCGTLTKDIVVNTDVLDENGALMNGAGNNFTPWTPMNVQSGVQVTLNGNGHTISGLYFNNETKNKVGLFGDVLGAVSISNLGIVDSYFKGGFNVGGLVGCNNGGSLSIENSYNAGTVSGSKDNVGGLVGYNGGELTITNSYNSGTVSGDCFVGGLVGGSISGELTIENSYNAGAVTGEYDVGGLVGNSNGKNAKLTITNSYNAGTVSGNSEVGGLVGRNGATLTITNSYNSGTVNGSGNDVGGLVGCNNGGSLSIENSYNSGTVSGDCFVGGLVGDNSATLTITNSYNAGPVSSSVSSICIGGLVGYNIGENAKLTITSSFFLETRKSGDDLGGEAKTLEEFHNGTVALLLHDWCEMDGDNCKVGGLNGTVWGQDFTKENSLPDLSGKFVGGTPCTLTLHTFEGDTRKLPTIYLEGSEFELPTDLTRENYVFLGWSAKETAESFADIVTSIAQDATGAKTFYAQWKELNADGCFEIASTVELYGFANVVNNATNGSQVCGKLTKDIVVNTGVLDEDGALNGGNFTPWTPMNVKSSVQVTLNGNGKTISGLYFNDENTDNVGLFGGVNGALSISDLGVKDSYFKGCSYVGGLVGESYNGTLTIENSYNEGTVSGGYVGGLVGGNHHYASLTITNSYNAGTVSGGYVGGLVGYVYDGTLTIANSYNEGSVSGSDYVGGLVGISRGEYAMLTITNSFFVATGGRGGDLGGEAKTLDDFHNGTVAFLLHNWCEMDGDNCKVGGLDGSVWGQDFTKENSLPDLSGKFVGRTLRTLTLHTFEGDTRKLPTIYLEGLGLELPTDLVRDGYIFSGWSAKETAESSADIVTSIASDATGKKEFYAQWKELNADGCFEIASTVELYGFANVVNNATNGSQVCGTLVDNIVVNTGVLDENGALNGSNFTPWTPMNVKSSVQVTFDGNGHTIRGLYVNDGDAEYVGLFGYIDESAKVQNVGVVDSYFKGGSDVGGLVGYSSGTLDIANSYNSGTVSGSGNKYVGGLVGYNVGTLTIKNSYNAGTVSGNENIGGLVGYSRGTLDITNSYNEGAVSGSGDNVGGVVGYNYNGTVSKVYNTGAVSGVAFVGGVVGYNNGGTVSNVYNTGSVSGSGDYVGGVVGNNYGTVSNAYNTGSVSGSGDDVGGVVGYNYNGTVSNVYNTGSVSGNSVGVGGVIGANNGTVSNAYYNTEVTCEGCADPIDGSAAGKTAAEFADGTVARLLHDWCEKDVGSDECKYGGLNGSIWGQDLAAENSLPDFSGVVGFKYGSITFFNLNDDGVADSASIDATAKAPVAIPNDIAVSKHVTFKRPFAGKGFSTIMLPFSVSEENMPAELKFYRFDKVEEINGKYTASYDTVKGLNAHTPYIVWNRGEDALSQVTFEGEFTLGTSVMPPPNSSSSAWEFNGTYKYKTWEKGDAGLGRTYGFAANDGVNNPKIVGQFAKVGAGAHIYPMRAYLEYVAPVKQSRPAANGAARAGAANTVASLPETINVVIVDKDETSGEQTTRVIGTINTRTGEFKFADDRWFDLNGRYLGNKKPTQKGAYYNNGKKVIVK